MAAWHQLIRFVRRRRVPSRLRFIWPADFPLRPPYTLGLPLPTGSQPSLLRPSIAPIREYRNINLLSIDYAFRPRLRIRLTLGGRTCPRKPWIFGEQDSHLLYRYSCLHLHLSAVQRSLQNTFNPRTTLSYPCTCSVEQAQAAASVPDLVPIIFGAESLDQ